MQTVVSTTGGPTYTSAEVTVALPVVAAVTEGPVAGPDQAPAVDDPRRPCPQGAQPAV